MRVLSSIVPLVAATSVVAFPIGLADGWRGSFSAALSFLQTPLDHLASWPSWKKPEGLPTTWENEFTYLRHPDYPNYQVRLKSPSLCDPGVKQYSGYLDIDSDKHLFFWFFEARKSPETAPLVMWLNGGPGGSSSIGLLFELGPCNIADSGRTTDYNKYGWNEHANMIFLDQPVNVGYSYSNHSSVSDSRVGAEDVYTFLQIFFHFQPKYAEVPFSIAAESYGGVYGPHIASTIHHHNKELSSGKGLPMLKHISLQSLMIGNGLTDPLNQLNTNYERACVGPFPIFNDTNSKECVRLRYADQVCHGLVKACYASNSVLACAPATEFCSVTPGLTLSKAGVNPYDTRMKCDPENGDLCYEEVKYIETWLNNATVKHELGVPKHLNYSAVNMEVNRQFSIRGEMTMNAATLIPELINDGVRVLVYGGEADYLCNSIGLTKWTNELQGHAYAEHFRAAPVLPWTIDGRRIGTVKKAGYGAGNFTYVSIHEAGHMAPKDQPEATLQMVIKWLTNVPIVP